MSGLATFFHRLPLEKKKSKTLTRDHGQERFETQSNNNSTSSYPPYEKEYGLYLDETCGGKKIEKDHGGEANEVNHTKINQRQNLTSNPCDGVDMLGSTTCEVTDEFRAQMKRMSGESLKLKYKSSLERLERYLRQRLTEEETHLKPFSTKDSQSKPTKMIRTDDEEDMDNRDQSHTDDELEMFADSDDETYSDESTSVVSLEDNTIGIEEQQDESSNIFFGKKVMETQDPYDEIDTITQPPASALFATTENVPFLSDCSPIPRNKTQDENKSISIGSTMNNDIPPVRNQNKKHTHIPKGKKKRKRLIPHEAKASKECSFIKDVDLNTSILNINLCAVRLVWGLRNSSRPFNKTMVKLHEYREDDGPLGIVHKQVLCLELEQLDRDNNNFCAKYLANHITIDDKYQWYNNHHALEDISDDEDVDHSKSLNQQTEETNSKANNTLAQPQYENSGEDTLQQMPHNQTEQPPIKRFRLFLYNEFAVQMADILGKYEKARKQSKSIKPIPPLAPSPILLLSLKNVPAMCIFPYHTHQKDSSDILLDHQMGRMAKYCICIGNKSKVFISEQDSFHARKDTEITECKSGKGTSSTSNSRSRQDFCTDDLHMNIAWFLGNALPSTNKETHDCISNINHENHMVLCRQSLDRNITKGTGPQSIQSEMNLVKNYIDLWNTINSEYSYGIKIGHSSISGIRSMGYQNFPKDDVRMDSIQKLPVHTKNENKNLQRVPICTSEKKRKRSIPNQYRKMHELIEILEKNKIKKAKQLGRRVPDSTVDLYGVVLGFTSPKITKKQDWNMNVTLVDESLQPMHDEITSHERTNHSEDKDQTKSTGLNHVTAIFFHKDKNELPKITSAGDILRLHRFKLQIWNGDIQLLSSFRSTFAVCRRKNEETSWSVHSPLLNTPIDFTRVEEIWKWGKNRLSQHPTIKKSLQHTLSQICERENTFDPNKINEKTKTDSFIDVSVDLTVMISGIVSIPENALDCGPDLCRPKGYLRGWDGTGPPISDPPLYDCDEYAHMAKTGDPPAEALSKISRIVKSIPIFQQVNQKTFCNTIQVPKSLCGRVVNIAIWEESHWQFLLELTSFDDQSNPTSKDSGRRSIYQKGITGLFVRLRNVTYGTWSVVGKKCIMVHRNSSLTPLPSWTYEVKNLLLLHQRRISSGDCFNQRSGRLPLESDKDFLGDKSCDRNSADNNESREQLNFQPLQSCITEPAPSKFHVIFRIIGTLPKINRRDLKKVGLFPLLSQNVPSSYRFAVQVCDEETEINVIVKNAAAEEFFCICADDVKEDVTKKSFETWKPEHKKAVEFCEDMLCPTSDGHFLGSNFMKGEIVSVIVNDLKYFVLDHFCAIKKT